MGATGGKSGGATASQDSSSLNTSDATIATALSYSYLYVQLGLCEGEIESVSDIRINNLPSNYYNAVAYDYRLGTESQTIMPQFAAIETTTSISSKVMVGSVTWGEWSPLYSDITPVYGYVYSTPTGYSYKLGYYSTSVSVVPE